MNKPILILMVIAILSTNVLAATHKPIKKNGYNSLVNKPFPKVKNVTALGASVIVAEAGAEGTKGMKAVTEVIRNRMKAKNASMEKVLTEHNQFTCFNRYRNKPEMFIAKWSKHDLYPIALSIITTYYGNEFSKGSLYYHEKKVHPEWSRGIMPTVIIGNHLFFANISYP